MLAGMQQATSTSTPLLPPLTNAGRTKARLKILHVISCLGVGGTEHGVLKVILGLGEEEFEHRLCVVRRIDDEFAQSMKVAGKVYHVGRPNAGFQFPLLRLARVMKDFRPHIVHSRNFGALEAIPAARIAGVPVAIHSEHGYELEILDGLPLRRRMLCRVCYSMADAVLAVTCDLSRYHSRQSWLPESKFRVIYNGVDSERFSPRAEILKQTRKELGIPSDRIVVGTVGRIVPIKDHGTLLTAAEILLRQGKSIHLLIVGAGPELATLQRRAAASPILQGRVTFTGASDRVPDLINVLDLFVLSSISEGMSNTVLEAMASGVPVVVTQTGGNSELVEDGTSGSLFPPRDFRALAQHLLRLVDDASLRRRLGGGARQRAIEHFGIGKMMSSYRELYCDLAARRNVSKDE